MPRWIFPIVSFATLLHAGETVRGIIQDAASQIPLPGVTIFVDSKNSTTSDAQGGFTLENVPPGRHKISADLEGEAIVTVVAGQEPATVKLQVNALASFAGRATNDAGDPFPHLKLYLLEAHYLSGRLQTVVAAESESDSEGHYQFEKVPAEREFLLLAKPAPKLIATDPDTPIPIRTFYHSPLRFTSLEHRAGVDFKVQSSRGYCLDGTIDSPGEAAPEIAIEEGLPEEIARVPVLAQVNPDHTFRVCGVPPGEYTAVALAEITEERSLTSKVSRRVQAKLAILVSKSDVHDLKITFSPRVNITGHVTWNPPPAPGSEEKMGRVMVGVKPDMRLPRGSTIGGSFSFGARVTVPGDFEIELLDGGPHLFDLSDTLRGVYLKELRYKGVKIHGGMVDLTPPSGHFEVVLGADGGSISARVNDPQGQPIPHAYLYIARQDAATEAEFAAGLPWVEIENGVADYKQTLAPGRYLVFASYIPAGNEATRIHRLWNERSHAKEVEVTPNATVQVQLGLH